MVENRARGNRNLGTLRSASSDPGLANISPSSLDGRPGSNSSVDLSATRSLGSRGSLCDDNADDCDSINVVVRCRPLNEKEVKRRDEPILSFPGEGQIWVNLDGVNGQQIQKPKVFTYNVVFESEATQEDVLEHSGATRLIDMAIDGFSCTIFCYGQTGSGKTHTLTGPPQLFGGGGADLFSGDHGLIFRSFVYLFNQLQTFSDREFTVKASFLEIYNEKVIDLLNMGSTQKPLQVRWNKRNRGFYVENLFSIECYELDDLLAVLEEGLRNRAVASHNMNEYSSRSHTILSVCISSEQKASEEGVSITKNGKLNFVDLAGSEMTKKTNSEGKTLEEANNINKSLMVLGTCISALSDPRKKDGHIPYRDSKLTKLLADSLAGSGVTLMIACVSPAKYNLSETLNTLRYASRAKRIRSKPIIIMDPKEKLIMSLQREVNQLQEENQHLKMLIDFGSSVTPPGLSSFVGNLHRIDSPSSANAAKSASLALAATIGHSDSMRKSSQSRRQSLRVDDEKLKKLDSEELVTLVKRYMVEHDNVKKENKNLTMMTTALIQDQEMMARENERLVKKLEDLKSGVNRSPIGSANPIKGRFLTEKAAYTNGDSQLWVNPMNGSMPNSAKNGKDNNESKPSSREGRKTTKKGNKTKKLEKNKVSASNIDLASSTDSSRISTSSSGYAEDISEPFTSTQRNEATGGVAGRKKNIFPRSKSVPRTKKATDKSEKKGFLSRSRIIKNWNS